MSKIKIVLPLSNEHISNKKITRKDFFIMTNLQVDKLRQVKFICLNFSGSQIPVKLCSKVVTLSLRSSTFLQREKKSGELIKCPKFFSYIRYQSADIVNSEIMISTFPSHYLSSGTTYIIFGPICSMSIDNVHKVTDLLFTFQGNYDFPRSITNEIVYDHFLSQQYFVYFALHPYSQLNNRLNYFNRTVIKANRNKSSNNYNYNLDVFYNPKTSTAIIRFSIVRNLITNCKVLQIISLEMFIGDGTLKYPENGKYFNPEVHTASKSEVINNVFIDLGMSDEF
jgi:hypothetical protein